MVALEMLAAFVLIVGGAIGFTNAVEWLGHRLNLGQGAVGALLAAVGTALPESVIPVVALLGGGGGSSSESVQVAIGAIIGAPFVLGTLAMLVIAGSALAFRGRREQGTDLRTDNASARRDLTVFLVLFPVGIVIGALDTSAAVQLAAAALLLAGYGVYTWQTVRHGGDADDDEELAALYFDTSKDDPPSTLQIALQFIVSLAAIVGGAELFVGAVESIAESLGVAPLVLSLVLAPLATELPEKANSILWVRDGKDTLAVGNVTGAMAFQATIPVAFGLAATGWELEPEALVAAVIALIGGAIALVVLPRTRVGVLPTLAWAALFVGFVVFVAAG
jgi:cation:H+ antiporter